MTDRYASHAMGLDSPLPHAFAVTPHDANTLPETTRALYVGSPGTLSVVMQSGAQVLLQGVAAGTLLPLRIDAVRATGTTASGLVGLV